MNSFNFNPVCRVYSKGSGDNSPLLVLFDTCLTNDENRTSTIVEVNGYTRMSIHVEYSPRDHSDQVDMDVVVLDSKIILKTGGSEVVLAEPKINLSLKFKDQVDLERQVNEISLVLKNSVIDAFRNAMSEFLSGVKEVRDLSNVKRVEKFKSSEISSRSVESEDSKSYRKKMIYMIVGVPILVIGLLWLITRPASQKNPVEDAVSQALASDPNSANAQVELTKKTLQSMGYDVNKAGDVGCLTAK